MEAYFPNLDSDQPPSLVVRVQKIECENEHSRMRFEGCRICIRDLRNIMATGDAPQHARSPMSRSSTSHSDVAFE